MSETQGTQQANIVFLGRESFRMQVVGTPALATDAGAIPSPLWEKTQRIIERRRSPSIERRRSNSERRQSPPRAAEVDVDMSVLAPGRSRLVVLSLIFFAGGALVATAVVRLSRSAGTATSVQATHVTPPPPAPVKAAVPPAVAVQSLPEPEPAPLPAPSPPPVKASAPVRVAASPGLRPRRAPPAPIAPRARTVEPAPFAPPAPMKAAGPTRKWVDPFAE